MKAVILVSILCSVCISSNATVLPPSEISFDDFAKHDMAEAIVQDVSADEDSDVDAVFKGFIASRAIHVYDNETMASPESEEPDPTLEPLMTITLKKLGNTLKPIESPEEVTASTEEDMDFSVREDVLPSPDDLAAIPEGMLIFDKRKTGPIEISEKTAEFSMEPELLEGMQ